MEFILSVFVHNLICLPGGESFPTDVNPTSSARKGAHGLPSSKSPGKAKNDRQLSGSGKRSQADIQKRMANDDDEPYRPPPGSMCFHVFLMKLSEISKCHMCILTFFKNFFYFLYAFILPYLNCPLS